MHVVERLRKIIFKNEKPQTVQGTLEKIERFALVNAGSQESLMSKLLPECEVLLGILKDGILSYQDLARKQGQEFENIIRDHRQDLSGGYQWAIVVNDRFSCYYKCDTSVLSGEPSALFITVIGSKDGSKIKEVQLRKCYVLRAGDSKRYVEFEAVELFFKEDGEPKKLYVLNFLGKKVKFEMEF